MSSVTRRIKDIKQPRGGYIKPSDFEIEDCNDSIVLCEKENTSPIIVGTAVDYLSRLLTGVDPQDAFAISMRGASIAENNFNILNAVSIAEMLLNGVKGLDEESIISACKLVTFDTWYRQPTVADSRAYEGINPDADTIRNIEIMVKRSASFFSRYGKVAAEGFTFEPPTAKGLSPIKQLIEKNEAFRNGKSYGGYTSTVNSGDGDFLTADTLWDFKVTKHKPTSKHTLQLLMYWIMGQHSGQEIYKNISRLGMFNPRLNIVYLLEMKNVPAETIKVVENDVICYPQILRKE